ncbi:unnamed protein product [Rotaria magnacalcarata]
MSLISTLEAPNEELDGEFLYDLLDKLQNGVIRKPENFNNLHFLLFLLYDSYGYERDRYPLWRWYYRIKKKCLTAKHLTIDTEHSRQYIVNAIEHLIDTRVTITKLIEEYVQVDLQYLNSPIHGLFNSYTPLHTYLYMERVDKPIINENIKIYQLFQSTITKLYQNLSFDLIHFSIAHRKTNLLKKIFNENTNWLDLSMNLTTERGWLPLHYACYVGDKDTVKTICDSLTTPKSPIHFDTISLLIPNLKQELFEKNPNEFILKTWGVEHSAHKAKQRKSRVQSSMDSHHNLFTEKCFQQKLNSNTDIRDQPALSTNIHNNSGINITNDNDIPDADELELSTLPLIQRDEFIDKLLRMCDTKQMLIPSPLTLACLAINGNIIDYEEIVKILLESHLVEFDGINHECILNHVVNYMHRKEYARFQCVQVYRDTEIEGPSTYVFYQFDGFIVNQDVKPLSSPLSGSAATLNTSKNDKSAESEDDRPSSAPTSVRCLITVLVLRDTFLQYPRWDFHLLRENIEEHFSDLENALGCRPTILYPDGDIISSRKRSDATWEIIVKYRLSSETGESLYMQVDYYFFDAFGDPLADALANVYQTPFYISCMTDSTVMMNTIFDSFFQRRNLHRWGTIASKHLEHCFDGILQIKTNGTTFLSLCSTLNHYYQLDGDPFTEENSATIQRIFVHAFACCVRRNAKIELDYLIRNHALIYYDSCRTKPNDIRHNILTYCVVRNLAVVFDQLMTNMKTSMYKTYQNSTNPDWQPHIAWKEIIHVIIDPVLQQQQQQNDFTQLACYGDANTNATSIDSIPVLDVTGEEYIRCINSRNTIVSKAKRKLTRVSTELERTRAITRQLSVCDSHQTKDARSDSNGLTPNQKNRIFSLRSNSNSSGVENNENLTKNSRNILKNVNRLRWRGKNERHSTAGLTADPYRSKKRASSPITIPKFNELSKPPDVLSLKLVYVKTFSRMNAYLKILRLKKILYSYVSDAELNDNDENSDASDANFLTKLILNHQPKLHVRKMIGDVQTQRYSSHRTALQHIQAMFRPIQHRINAPIEYEQIPMTRTKRTMNLQRTASIYNNEIKNDEKIRNNKGNTKCIKNRIQLLLHSSSCSLYF